MNKKHNAEVFTFLKTRGIDGATITEIIKVSKLTRDNVRIALAALEGARKIVSRSVGKAKLFRITLVKNLGK